MTVLTGLLLAVAFGAELAAFAGAGVGVASLFNGGAGVLIGVATSAVVVMVWARWCAPRSASRLSDPELIIVQVAVFALAVAVLWVSGHPVFALMVAGLALHLPLVRVVGLEH